MGEEGREGERDIDREGGRREGDRGNSKRHHRIRDLVAMSREITYKKSFYF